MKNDSNRSPFTIDISQETTRILPGHRPKKDEKPSVSWFFVGAAGQIGFSILVPLLLGVAGGIFVDSRFGFKPVGVLSGLAIGIILSVLSLVRTIQELIRSQPK